MIDVLTGGNGFIGKRLRQKLRDAMAVGHDDIGSMAWPDCDRFFFLSTYGNLAGQDDVHEIIRANIGHLGYVLASYIQESSVNSFVFVSSSSVTLPVQTAYSRMKRAGEEMVLGSALPACVVRPFSVTGVGEQEQHLIPKLIRSCLEREEMKIVLDATHDYVDVADVVDGLIKVADHRITGVMEFGKGTAISNAEVLDMVEYVTGKKANWRSVETMRPYDTQRWCCENFAVRPEIWSPKKTLEDSIEEMVDAYKFRRKNK